MVKLADAWDAGCAAGAKREREQWFDPNTVNFPPINPYRMKENPE